MKNSRQVSEVSFEGQTFFCGIDVHKKSWTVTLMTDDITLKTFSQNPDSGLLKRYLDRNYPGGHFIAGYEAGYFGFGIQRQFSAMGIDCQVLHAADIPTTHKEKDQKADPRDSKKIARTLRTEAGQCIWIPTPKQELDRQLIRTRKKFVIKMARVKNQIKSFLVIHSIPYPSDYKESARWSSKFVQWLGQVKLAEESGSQAFVSYYNELVFLRSELARIDRQIKRMAESEQYRDVFKKLMCVAGIGHVTAMTFLTEIGDITRFKDTDHLKSYVGLIPRSHSSGENDRQGRMTNRANPHLRSLVVEMAWIAIRRDPVYLHKFQSYCRKTKPNKAIIRIASWMVNRIFYIMKNPIN